MNKNSFKLSALLLPFPIIGCGKDIALPEIAQIDNDEIAVYFDEASERYVIQGGSVLAKGSLSDLNQLSLERGNYILDSLTSDAAARGIRQRIIYVSNNTDDGFTTSSVDDSTRVDVIPDTAA